MAIHCKIWQVGAQRLWCQRSFIITRQKLNCGQNGSSRHNFFWNDLVQLNPFIPGVFGSIFTLYEIEMLYMDQNSWISWLNRLSGWQDEPKLVELEYALHAKSHLLIGHALVHFLGFWFDLTIECLPGSNKRHSSLINCLIWLKNHVTTAVSAYSRLLWSFRWLNSDWWLRVYIAIIIIKPI